MISRWLSLHLPSVRQALARITYDYISAHGKDGVLLLMNHGFDYDPDTSPLDLCADEEKNRYEIQLYHHVASAINWAGLDALEVSSGRGGGARHITHRFRPRSFIGVDFSRKAVHFCNRYYSIEGLSFVHGNAESLQFSDNAFDIVISIEASSYYPRIERFLGHVVRVLRPGGYFLYADMRYGEEMERWRAQLAGTGLELLSEEDITPNAIRALVMVREQRTKLIQSHVPSILRGAFSEFAGLDGAGLVLGPPAAGERTYRNFVLRKRA